MDEKDKSQFHSSFVIAQGASGTKWFSITLGKNVLLLRSGTEALELAHRLWIL